MAVSSSSSSGKDNVTESMNRIGKFSFTRYTDRDYCRWCTHNQLPWAPDSLRSER